MLTPDFLAYPIRHVTDSLHLRLLDLDEMTIDQHWNAANVRSGFWRLYVNDRGGPAVVLADGTRYSLAARRVHFVPAWVTFTCVNDRPVRHLYCHFELLGLPVAASAGVFDRPVTLPRRADLEAMAAGVAAAVRRAGDERPGVDAVCRAKAFAYAALGELVARLEPARRAALDAAVTSPSPVAPAVRYVESHLGEPLWTNVLAERCSLSPDHFARVFRKLMGQTPTRYVLDRRIAAAAQMLTFTDASIDQVAERCGFPNRFYFSRVFARRMGTPPAAYRRTPRV